MKRLEVNVCQKMKKMVVLLLCLCLFLSGLPISEVQASDKNNEYIEEVSSEEEYFLPIIVEENCVTQGDEEVDYIVEEDSLFVNIENITCDTIDSEVISEMDVKVVGDTQYVELEEISEECNIEVVEEEDRTVYVKPFQTKSLIVEAEGKLPKVDATRIVKEEDTYILEFATEEDTEEAYEVLENSKRVTSVEGENVYHSFSLTEKDFWSGSRLSWGADYINSPQAISYAETIENKEEVVVAVIDTGIDSDHPYLKDRIHPDSSEMSFGSYEDGDGHGTHVAGIIVANTPSNVSILTVKGLNSDGYGSDRTLASAIDYAVTVGADVINMSWGGYEYWTADVLKNAVKNAYDAGVTLVAAAGNDSSDAGHFFPASSVYCITVSASKEDGSKASFSNFGACVNVSAPGVKILSTYLDGGYAMLSGTSMSAPFVAAACAMEQTINGKKTPLETKLAVTSHVTPFTDGCTNRGKGIIDFTAYIDGITCVEPVLFNYASGYYEQELEITLSCETEDARIYYIIDEVNSIDGEKPGEENGILYTEPIRVTKNTVIRAAAYKEGLFPSKATRATYRYDNCDTEDAYMVDSTGALTAYLGYQLQVEIPKEIRGITVTAVGDEVFRESAIEEIILPETVTHLGDNAFREAYSLKKVQARGVRSIGKSCFYGAENLKEIHFDSLQTMGTWCFAETYSLTEVDFPELTVISQRAFSGSMIKNVTADKVEIVEEKAFGDCYNLSNVSLKGVRRIEKNAFYESTLSKITMPQVEYIGEKAFYWNDSLKEIYSEKLERIEKEAFASCERLRKVDLPNIKYIGYSAFKKCKLSYLNMPKVEWAQLNSCTLMSDITEINLPEVLYLSITSASGVERINVPKCVYLGGFSGNSQLKEVYAPNVVEVSGFSNCKQLKELCFPLAYEWDLSGFAGEMAYAPKAKIINLEKFPNLKYGIFSECTEATLYLKHSWETYFYVPELQILEVKANNTGEAVEKVDGHINLPMLRRISFDGQYFPIALTQYILMINENGRKEDLEGLSEPLQLYSNNKALYFSSGATNYKTIKPPVLREDLPNDFQVTKDNFLLEVAAYCADAKYEWYYSKDGKAYTKFAGNKRDRLIPSKSGYYFCKITDNESGNYIDTKKCKVTVGISMKKLNLQFNDVSVCIGEEIISGIKTEEIWVPADINVRVLYNGDFEKIYLDKNKVIETDGIDFVFEASKDMTVSPEAKKSIQNAKVEILGVYSLDEAFRYKMIMNVTCDGEKLKESKDYEIYEIAKTKETSGNSITMAYLIKGIGEYAGAVGGLKSCVLPRLDKCEIRPIEDTIYTGEACIPEVEILYCGEVLPKSNYSCEHKNNIEPGTATITITGNENLTGTKELTYEIYIPMSDVTVTYEKEKIYHSYWGTVTNYTVSHDEYKVTYDTEWINDDKVGTAAFRLTGKGVFRGTLEFEYEILPKPLEEYYERFTKPVPQEYSHIYTGLPIEARFWAVNLSEGKDYVVTYENNVEPGIATIIMTGIGNYTGTIGMEFEIVPPEAGSFADKIHIINKGSYYYTGSPIEVEVYGEGLKEGEDYVVSYKDNVELGIATVKVTGIGDYTGVRGTTYEIVKAPIDKNFFRMEKEIYHGTIQTITPCVVSEKYQKGRDYTVEFSQDKRTKKGVATITGIGNYEGRITLIYNIIPYEKSVVTGLSSISNHYKKIKLSWKKVEDATGYQIYDVNKKKVVKTVIGCSATITKLKRNNLYRYKVRPYYKAKGKTYYGKYSNITICKTAPKPTFISEWGKSGKEYRVYCGDFGIVKGVDGIELIISNSKDFNGSVVIRKHIKKKFTKTILRNLKKGTYYVKARTYYTYVNEKGKKVKSYSKYCTRRIIKIKKDI